MSTSPTNGGNATSRRSKRSVATIYRKAAKLLDEHPELWRPGNANYSGERANCFCAMQAVCIVAGRSKCDWGYRDRYPGSFDLERSVLASLGPGLPTSTWMVNDSIANRHGGAKYMAKILRKYARALDHGAGL